MHFVPAALTLLVLALPTLCALLASSPITIEKAKGSTSGKHIVTLNEGVDKARLISQVTEKACNVTDQWDIINGFSGYCDDSTLAFLRAHADVAHIEEDGIVRITELVIQTNAPWGLERISEPYHLNSTDASSLSYHYTYDISAGAGVDIYIIDTGIYTQHSAFQGRATWGATFGGYVNEDRNGHGTHIAGTAAGYEYGVAQSANLIAVKVLDDNGDGRPSDAISGLDWVRSHVASTGRPSVASLSFEGHVSKALDAAVSALTAKGIHVVVAAGNSNRDISYVSPARVKSAITVGATDITDARASFSNYGEGLNVFAPGVHIVSAWIGNPFSIYHLDGTSMAAPHVSGMVAYFIGLYGNISPGDMINRVQEFAVVGTLSGIPADTANFMAQI